MAELTAEENERVRAALRKRLERGGISDTAAALEVDAGAMLGIANGRAPASEDVARKLAELGGTTLDVLLGRRGAPAAALPKRAEAIALARKDGVSEAVLAKVESMDAAGAESRSLLDWMGVIRDVNAASGPLPVVAPMAAQGIAQPAMMGVPAPAPPLSEPAAYVPTTEARRPSSLPPPPLSQQLHAVPVAPPPPPAASLAGIPAPIPPAAAAGSEPTPTEPTLSIFEFASLSMGLELLPHRVDDVYATFGLTAVDARTVEHAYWEAHFAKSPRERRELPAMREHMRRHWLRFDGQIAAPVVAPPAAPARRDSEDRAPLPPPISLEAYAAICAELRLTPAREQDIFAFYGLGDAALRAETSRCWEERLAAHPSEKQEFERLFWEKHRQLEQLATRSSATPPVATKYVAAVAPPKGRSAIVIKFSEYVVMCVELEMSKNREKVYAQYGLQDLHERRQIEEEWRSRLEADPALLAEWRKQTDELRANWIDFDSP